MSTYRINEAQISHELIDGEVIIINFDNGNYFSLRGPAAQLWQALAVSPATADQLTHALSPAPPAGAGEEIEAFLSELAAENLLTADSVASPSAPATIALAYEKPVVNKYTDMQQLLLADPLHDVDEAGWPQLPPNA